MTQSNAPLTLSLIEGDYAIGARSIIGQTQIYSSSYTGINNSANFLNYNFDVSGLKHRLNKGAVFSILLDTNPLSTGYFFINGGYLGLDNSTSPSTVASQHLPNYSGGQLIRLIDGIASPAPSSINPLDITFATYVDTSGAIPEPTTWSLLILGFGGIGATMRRRMQRASTLAAT